MPKRKSVAALATAGVLVAAALVVPATADAASSSIIVPNSTPTWLAKATYLGHASNSAAVSARVYLAPRGGLAALASAAKAVSTPGTAADANCCPQAQYA